jgi:hypothetical protein
MARRLRNSEEILCVLDINNENVPDFSLTYSDYAVTDSEFGESKSRTSDGKTGLALVSGDCHELTHLDPGPGRTIPHQNIEQGAVITSHFDWDTEPVEYFYFLFDLHFLALILQEIVKV